MEENIGQIQQAPVQNPVPVAVQPRPPKSRAKMGLLFLGLVAFGCLVFAGYQFWQAKNLERERGRRIGGINVYDLHCQTNSDCVLAQSLEKDACCHCPFAVSNTELEKNKDLIKWPKITLEEIPTPPGGCKDIVCKPCAYFPKASCLKQKCTVISSELMPTPTLEALATPTPDPMVGWKTYTNTKYGYTVKYPEGWEANRGPENLSDKELALQRDIDFYDPNLPSEDPGTGLNIRVNELEAMGANRNCSNLDDCFIKTFSWLTESTTINKIPSTFLDQPAVTFTYHRGTKLYNQSWKYIYFIYKENAYNIHISTNTTREKTVFGFFDQIISTIKFLN